MPFSSRRIISFFAREKVALRRRHIKSDNYFELPLFFFVLRLCSINYRRGASEKVSVFCGVGVRNCESTVICAPTLSIFEGCACQFRAVVEGIVAYNVNCASDNHALKLGCITECTASDCFYRVGNNYFDKSCRIERIIC